MNRREFITLFGGAATWPLAARAQQPAMPVIGYLTGGSNDPAFVRIFLQGLGKTGFVDGKNVVIEYRSANGQYDRLPSLATELIHRQVDVIATPGSNAAALAAKAATTTIPIVFGTADDPIKLDLVTSFARPEGNVTGVYFFSVQLVAKQLALLHELVPNAKQIAVLANPANAANIESMLGEISKAAAAIELQIHVLRASTIGEIDMAFAGLSRLRADALFVAPDNFFVSRRVQFSTLAARYAIPACYFSRSFVEAGGLMSYGTDREEMFHQVGDYTGRILRGAKPRDLPVVQSTKFEFVINLTTARALGLDVPPTLLTITDEVIE
jgi:putative tryptophan/tyrosine transport system substrate-binding protein